MPLLCYTETKSAKESKYSRIEQLFVGNTDFFITKDSIGRNNARKETAPTVGFAKGTVFYIRSTGDGVSTEDIYDLFELTEDASVDAVREELISCREKLLKDSTL